MEILSSQPQEADGHQSQTTQPTSLGMNGPAISRQHEEKARKLNMKGENLESWNWEESNKLVDCNAGSCSGNSLGSIKNDMTKQGCTTTNLASQKEKPLHQKQDTFPEWGRERFLRKAQFQFDRANRGVRPMRQPHWDLEIL